MMQIHLLFRFIKWISTGVSLEVIFLRIHLQKLMPLVFKPEIPKALQRTLVCTRLKLSYPSMLWNHCHGKRESIKCLRQNSSKNSRLH
ncbi:hypothetical protein HanRHA438_Chr15g0696871 [Helianthus annuus]|nr:hypothetical protein HanXRQr2_Chr15g0684871 [Helianthus annuus]KAJ0450585.1 hypothetical protein HanHA300_Chr15g0557941 [Helianthus annuus]KAJ0472437.1 hypothetical protein HanHA89_Chr15g0607051 [Helianthus annuus]KAJ0648038.1 hypothetical protein HanLR1_Chr15g0568411 [Helianthus annuus]KAJ0843937.1 hypothetical protein HanRHA438_Chr15g0696871 [Helianthus annuus]